MTSQDRWQSHKVCLVMGAGRILCARFWTLKKDISQFRACRKHRRAFCVPLDASCKKPFRLEAMYSTDPKVGTHLYGNLSYQFSSVQFSRSVVSDSLWSHESQHTRPPCPSPTPGVHSDSRPSSQWCHPAIPSSVVSFSFCPQSLPASESFPRSQN